MLKTNPSKISVLIVNYNGYQHLEECLNSLKNQTNQNFEIVIVDNNSEDKSCDYIKSKHPDIKLFKQNENLGFAKGNNIGSSHCTGDYLFLLNNDTKVDDNCIDELFKTINQYPETNIFALMMVDFENPEKIDSGGDTIYTSGIAYKYNDLELSDEIFEKPRSITSACGGAFVINKYLYEKLNGFDEDLFLLFEDVDLSLRAQHMGEKILFIPHIKVYHKGSSTIGVKSYTSHFYCNRNLFLVKLKNYPIKTLFKYALYEFITTIFTLVIYTKRGFLFTFIKSKFSQVRMMPLFLRKRKIVISNSKLSSMQFESLLKKDWLKERIIHHLKSM